MFYYVHYQFIATLQKYNWFFLVYWLLSCNFAELIYQLNRKFTFLAFFFFMGHTSLILWISCNLFCCCWKLVVLDNVANVSSYSLLLGIVLLLLACFFVNYLDWVFQQCLFLYMWCSCCHSSEGTFLSIHIVTMGWQWF